MKLKTLKDLKQKEDDIGDARYNLGMENLKKEAIKWIKGLNSEFLTISNGLASTEEGHESYKIKQTNKSALILWIKHFFNITGEDLIC